MFFGESSHPLDAKSRFHVPKRIQAALARNEDGDLRVVVTRGFDGCLFLFSEEGFQGVLAAWRTKIASDPSLRRVQRLFFSKVHATALDAAGRLLLPENLRAHADIAGEVAIVGVGDRAEIWDRAKWDAFESEHSGELDALAEALLGDGTPPGPPGEGGG